MVSVNRVSENSIRTVSKYLEFADINVKRLFKNNKLIAKRVEFGPMSKSHGCYTIDGNENGIRDKIAAIETAFGKNGRVSSLRVKIHELNARLQGLWCKSISPKKFKKIQKEPFRSSNMMKFKPLMNTEMFDLW